MNDSAVKTFSIKYLFCKRLVDEDREGLENLCSPSVIIHKFKLGNTQFGVCFSPDTCMI